jgi:hypothetical protein
VHEEGECEGERAERKCGLCGGTAELEGGSDVTGTQACWLSKIGDKGGREICTRSEMGWNTQIETWNDEPEAASLPEQCWELDTRYHWIIVEAGNEWPVHIAVVSSWPWNRAGGERSGPRDRDGNTWAAYMWS